MNVELQIDLHKIVYSNSEIKLQGKISKLIKTEDHLLIMYCREDKFRFRNIFCYDISGKEKWVIDPPLYGQVENGKQMKHCYIRMNVSEQGELLVYAPGSCEYKVNWDDGSVELYGYSK